MQGHLTLILPSRLFDHREQGSNPQNTGGYYKSRTWVDALEIEIRPDEIFPGKGILYYVVTWGAGEKASFHETLWFHMVCACGCMLHMCMCSCVVHMCACVKES